MNEDRKAPSLGPPIARPPAYMHVAERIRRAIQLGRFARGERLPSEARLVEQLGFSRVTVREAIRRLEGEGYLETRRGARGGLFVKRRDETREARLSRLRGEWTRITDLYEFRAAVESRAAGLAALRRGDADIARLERALAGFRAGGDSPAFRRADSEFHLAIADASANAYLQQASEEARAGMFLPLDALEFAVPLWAEQPAQHAAILEAIRAGERARAEAAMAAHLEASCRLLRGIVWDGAEGGEEGGADDGG